MVRISFPTTLFPECLFPLKAIKKQVSVESSDYKSKNILVPVELNMPSWLGQDTGVKLLSFIIIFKTKQN